MTTWPGSLPQSFMLSGASVQEKSKTIRSQTDYGPDIIRRRFTNSVEEWNGRMLMTNTQYATAKAFKETTLNEVDVFDWVHPITGAAVIARFMAQDPTALQVMGNVSGNLYLVNIKVEFIG